MVKKMVELIRQNYKNNKKIYDRVKKQLQDELDSNIPIDHVGSTAIVNMYGKNIIDILIGAKDKDEFEYIKSVIEKNGFIASLKSSNDIYQFFSSTSGETASGDVHIHLVIKNTEMYLEFLILKYYLQHNKFEAKKYSDFKRKLVSSGVKDRKEYKKEKSEYVLELLKRAKEYCNQNQKFKLLNTKVNNNKNTDMCKIII